MPADITAHLGALAAGVVLAVMVAGLLLKGLERDGLEELGDPAGPVWIPIQVRAVVWHYDHAHMADIQDVRGVVYRTASRPAADAAEAALVSARPLLAQVRVRGNNEILLARTR